MKYVMCYFHSACAILVLLMAYTSTSLPFTVLLILFACAIFFIVYCEYRMNKDDEALHPSKEK